MGLVTLSSAMSRVFFFQAEDGIRDHCVTGVQTCALPISPILMSPPPMQSVFLDPATKGVNFTWTPVDNVREYHLKISKNASFTELIVDDKKPTTQVLVTNLPEGVYYWQVLSIGMNG